MILKAKCDVCGKEFEPSEKEPLHRMKHGDVCGTCRSKQFKQKHAPTP